MRTPVIFDGRNIYNPDSSGRTASPTLDGTAMNASRRPRMPALIAYAARNENSLLVAKGA